MTRQEELNFIKDDVENFYSNIIKCNRDFYGFYDYVDYAGWQDWMSNYCDNEDDLTESEIQVIEEIQEEGFNLYLESEEEKEKKFIEDCYSKLDGIKDWWNNNVKDEYKLIDSEDEIKGWFVDDVINGMLLEIPSFKTKSGHPEIFRY